MTNKDTVVEESIKNVGAKGYACQTSRRPPQVIRNLRVIGIPSRINSSMNQIPSTEILGRLAREDRFVNQRFGRWREVFCLQAFLGKESAMLYIRAERIVRRSICRIDGMDTPSGG